MFLSVSCSSLSTDGAFPGSDIYSAVQSLVLFEMSSRFKDFVALNNLHLSV